MKKSLILILVVIISFAFNSFAEEKSANEQVMMKKWMEYSTPGKYHKDLEYFTGKWTAVSKMWMKPGDKPIESKGTQRGRMIMDGRFLIEHMSGSSMGINFTGMSVRGYDNLNKKFVGYWIDSTATGVFPFEGSIDKTGKIRTDTAVWDDFMTGGKQNVKMVTTIIDDNTYKFEMFMKPVKAPEYKSMEMLYSRVKCGEGKRCCDNKKSENMKKCCKKKETDKKGKCKKGRK